MVVRNKMDTLVEEGGLGEQRSVDLERQVGGGRCSDRKGGASVQGDRWAAKSDVGDVCMHGLVVVVCDGDLRTPHAVLVVKGT